MFSQTWFEDLGKSNFENIKSLVVLREIVTNLCLKIFF